MRTILLSLIAIAGFVLLQNTVQAQTRQNPNPNEILTAEPESAESLAEKASWPSCYSLPQFMNYDRYAFLQAALKEQGFYNGAIMNDELPRAAMVAMTEYQKKNYYPEGNLNMITVKALERFMEDKYKCQCRYADTPK